MVAVNIKHLIMSKRMAVLRTHRHIGVTVCNIATLYVDIDELRNTFAKCLRHLQGYIPQGKMPIGSNIIDSIQNPLIVQLGRVNRNI